MTSLTYDEFFDVSHPYSNRFEDLVASTEHGFVDNSYISRY